MQHLIDLIDRWQPKRAVVVGDFMLDHHIHGAAERLSPDAPVPVLRVEREEHRPGGASNVCIDLRALRCEVVCLGVVGRDEHAEPLIRKLNEAGCDTRGLMAIEGRPTTVKRSYVGLAQDRHPQKMFRVDFEDARPISRHTRNNMLVAAQLVLRNADVLCIEDYNKGVVSEPLCRMLVEMAEEAGVPVLVDPAACEDYSKYRGATAITPNRTEAQRATGLPAGSPDELDTVAHRLLDDLRLEAVVLTLDRHGALLLERGCAPRRIPTAARSVYDVTGAGDMVLAALASARANGADWSEAVELANVAAGLEVERFGVVPIELEQVHLSLLQHHHRELGKLRTLNQLLPELHAYRSAGKRVAFTNGCFDILHAGHVDLLRGARATADLLVLAVNTDASIRALKGDERPIVPEADRIKVLSELECVDYIVRFGDGSEGEADTPIPLLRTIRPDVLVKGGAYKHEEVVGWEIVEEQGGRVVTIPHMEGRSTTNIVDTIRGR